MRQIKALSLAPDVKKWLSNTLQPRVLHVFGNACNLINEHRDVLSIVTPQIGNGPFNLVVEEDVNYVEQLSIDSPISIASSQLQLRDITYHIADAKLWNPRPDWERLHKKREIILNRIKGIASGDPSSALSNDRTAPLRTTPLAMTDVVIYQFPISQFSNSLVIGDLPAISMLVPKLAGLGSGLTPSGDDFLMGAMYAAWIIHPREVASKLGNGIAEIAAPLTTSLSGAWIRSAGRGGAGQVWHEFLDALLDGDEAAIQLRVDNILAVGETSGADALAGFLSTIKAYMASFSRNAATSSAE